MVNNQCGEATLVLAHWCASTKHPQRLYAKQKIDFIFDDRVRPF